MQKGKIRVLECIRQGKIGGGESHLLSLVAQLDRTLYEPIVLSFTEGPMVDRLRDMGIEVHVIYTEKPFNIAIWGKVKRFVQSLNIDLIHAHGTRANSNVFWAAKTLGIPLIYTVHGWSFHDDQSFLVKTFRVQGERLLAYVSDLNISVSKTNQETGKKHFSSFDSVIINNGIDLDKFNPEHIQSNFRSELSIPQDAIVLTFIARLNVQKQPLALLEGFSKVYKDLPNLHLVLIGEGEEQEKCDALIKELGLKVRFHFLPFRNDVAEVLKASDIYILPSLWEGLPIGLLEAMAMEKAIIASKADGTIEIIQNGENGIFVELEALSTNIAKAIQHLYSDSELRKKLGTNARKTIQTQFSAQFMTRQIEAKYQELLKK
jgi:glycosyltransferase involved in cell wall biosynthesis